MAKNGKRSIAVQDLWTVQATASRQCAQGTVPRGMRDRAIVKGGISGASQLAPVQNGVALKMGWYSRQKRFVPQAARKSAISLFQVVAGKASNEDSLGER